jgi:hypothetical protein
MTFDSMMTTKLKIDEIQFRMQRLEKHNAMKIESAFHKFRHSVKKISFDGNSNNVDYNFVDFFKILSSNTLKSYRGHLWTDINGALNHHSESLTELVLDGKIAADQQHAHKQILMSIIPNLKNLKTLSFDAVICDTELIDVVCKMPKLETFTLGTWHSVYHEICKLSEVKTLRNLKIGGNEYEEALCEYRLPVMATIEEFTCTLMLSMNNLALISECFPNLKRLKILSQLDTLENDFYFDAFPNLERLSKVQGRFRIFKTNATIWPKIKEINFKCGSITADAVKKFPNLEVLQADCEFNVEIFKGLLRLNHLKELKLTLYEKKPFNWTLKEQHTVDVINQLCQKIRNAEIRVESTVCFLMRHVLRELCVKFYDF